MLNLVVADGCWLLAPPGLSPPTLNHCGAGGGSTGSGSNLMFSGELEELVEEATRKL